MGNYYGVSLFVSEHRWSPVPPKDTGPTCTIKSFDKVSTGGKEDEMNRRLHLLIMVH